jgi:uncharacterized protein (TIGR03437 family)
MRAKQLHSIAITALFLIAPLSAQNVITTIAGADWLFPADGRRAVDAPLGAAGLFVAAELQGVWYIADAENFTVMRVGTDGVLRVIAGTGIPGHTGDGGPASNAGIAAPTGIATDGRGTIYIAFTDRIRKVDTKGVITTIAGTGTAGFSGDGGQASLARFDGIVAIAVDSADAVLVADSRNGRIRRIAANGVVTTLTSGLDNPAGVAADRSGNVYFTETAADGSGLLRVIAPAGDIRTIDALRGAGQVAVDNGGAVLVSDPARGSIYRLAPQTAFLTLLAGPGQPDATGLAGDGGPALAARLNQAGGGLAVNALGDLFVGDTGNGRVRRIGANGIIATVAGNGAFRDAGSAAGPAIAATLYRPAGMAMDTSGNLYIAEPLRHRVRRIAPNGTISVFAGTGQPGNSGDGGAAVNATLNGPTAVAYDTTRGHLYIADTLNNRIRRVASDGRMEAVYLDGFNRPQGVALDASGNLYIADTENHRIHRVAPDGSSTVLAGAGARGFAIEGGPALTTSLNRPTGIAVDAAGQIVYFSDSGSGRVRRIFYGGINTVAESLDNPAGLVLDRDGNLFVAEAGAHRVRRIETFIERTVAGTGSAGYSGDGGPGERATLRSPSGLALDASGSLIIADQLNHRIRQILNSLPSVRVTPATLSFSIPPGGDDPGAQTFFVASSLPGVPFTIAAGSPWVKVEPTSGQTPATVEVRVDPKGLSAGESAATITVSAPQTSNRQDSVAVTARFSLGVAPGLKIDSEPLSYALSEGGERAAQTIVVSNYSDGAVSFTAAGRTRLGWLTVSPSAGNIPPRGQIGLTVTSDPTVLTAATYTGNVEVREVGDNDVRNLPVTATVTKAVQSIFLTHAGLTFTAVAGGSATPPQPVGVLNLGRDNMAWTASASGLAGAASWLTVSPARGASGPAGSAPAELLVSVNHAGLTAGDYYGQVQVAAGDADNSPQIVLIVLTVLPSGSTPTPIPLPSTLIFNAAFGGPSPGAQTAAVYNLTNRVFTYSAGRATASGGQWLQFAPSAGAIAGGEQGRIVVQPFSEGLAPGVYRGSVTLLFDNGTPRTIQVVLVVSGTGALSPRKGQAREAGDCSPNTLVPVFTSLASEVALPAGWPQRLIVRVLDNCGAPVAAGAVSAQFTNNIPPANLVSLKDGNWVGTWQARAAAPVTIKVKAQAPEQSLSGSAEITTTIRANDTPPLLGAVPVVNTASFDPGAPLAPGMLVRISGARLAQGSATAAAPLPTQLAGATVAIAGHALPLLRVAEDSIDAIVPFDIPVNSRVQMIVQRSGAAAAPENVTISPAQPALFSRDRSGTGQGDISKTGPDGQLTPADPSAPVSAGDTIAIRCTGLGVVDGDGKVQTPVAVTVGGVDAGVVSAVAAPGSAGVYIIQARLAEGTPSGDAVGVIATSAKRASAPVTIAVR